MVYGEDRREGWEVKDRETLLAVLVIDAKV
jgi:hypothetical protein